jgi:hypothetical protein
MMELFLSSDGKHTVHVAAQSAQEMEQLLPNAKAVYEAVVREYGTKAEMWKHGGNGHGKVNGTANGDEAAIVPEPDAPLCPVHKTPMAYRQGRYGAFWSCPKRLDDGSWCDCTIEVNGR